jgi:hypothetical protein
VLIGNHGEDLPWVKDSVILSFDPLRMSFPNTAEKLVRHELNLDPLRMSFPNTAEKLVRHELNLEDPPGSQEKKDFTGYQLLRVSRQSNTWKADNNAIYDSILYPLAKAWSYQVDRHHREREEDREEHGMEYWQFPSIYYVFPIIVTSGQVFTVDMTSGEPEVSEVKWARVRRSFNSEDLKCDLRADLVSFDHWEEYLGSRIIKIIDYAENALARNVHLYDPEWLLSNFGEPDDPDDQDEFNSWLIYFREEKKRARS